jgi:hypothetical protein
LYHERPAAAVDQRLDGLELAVVEVGLRPAHQLAQHGEGLTPRPGDRFLIPSGTGTGAGGRSKDRSVLVICH